MELNANNSNTVTSNSGVLCNQLLYTVAMDQGCTTMQLDLSKPYFPEQDTKATSEVNDLCASDFPWGCTLRELYTICMHTTFFGHTIQLAVVMLHVFSHAQPTPMHS